jgi:protoheme IX farnesyltransferase
MLPEKQLFKFSLYYLACLFGALVADKLLLA